MQLPFDILTQDIIDDYNLNDISHNGKVYIDIRKGVYGLPQYGRVAYYRLRNHMEKHGYQLVKFTPGLCTQKSIPIYFTLIVDGF